MEVIENTLRYVKIQNSQNQQMGYFSPLCQLQLSTLQNRPCFLFPVLLECITNMNCSEGCTLIRAKIADLAVYVVN